MFKRILASIVIAFFIIGCGSPRIDTSSDEKMKASIEEIKKSLSDEKRKDFEDALKVVYFSKVNFDLKSIMALGAEGTAEKIKEEGKALISNKTADEVISEAKKIKEKIFEEEKKKALEEINALEEKKEQAQKSAEELKKVQLVSGSFNSEDAGYKGYKQVTLTLNVKNNTEKAISRIYAIGTIKSEGREVPWIKEDFNYMIDGGIEPGETNTSSLSPNMFSSWGTANIGENATFTVKIVRIDGADGNIIASIQEFSEKDNQRLEDLKTKYINK